MKTWIVAVVLAALCPMRADAVDISAKKLSIKDTPDPAKRQIAVQSADPAVQFSQADDPAANGASLHVYSATDDFCIVLPSGSNWQNKGSLWKFSDKATKDSAQVGNGKLSVKIKSGVTYTLADNATQGAVNVQVQFGNGTRYCMRCSNVKKDTAKKFLGKGCAATACDAEPTPCGSIATTSTTTTTTSSTTTSTACSAIPTSMAVKGALTPTVGRFNYNLTLGLPGANNACNANFPGSHACTIQDLQAAPASDLACLRDVASGLVTSFWAIDGTAPVLQQCNDDAIGGSGLNWEYGTAHTASRGERVAVSQPAGALGPVQMSIQCNIAGNSWVGCCQ
jgi:hypothetical protein